LPNLARFDYVDRVNRVVDHVLAHLAEPLRLVDLAEVAHFSQFHFHRIFTALMGETVHAFVKRVRLERSLPLIAHRPGLSFTEIALSCGFSSSSDFSRSFRAHYGVPPRHLDLQRLRAERRAELWTVLEPEQRHRYDVGLEVPAGTTGSGDVGTVDFAPMTVAEVDVRGPIDQEVRALGWLYRSWLPCSGFVPDNMPCFEAWHAAPYAGPDGEVHLRVQLAVTAATHR
jgi:AraC-like DNA-binding protein